VLIEAINKVSQLERPGLLCVADELRAMDTETSYQIAAHIESLSNTGYACLLFSRGDTQKTINLDSKLNIIQVAGLPMPDASLPTSEYVASDLVSVAILMVISSFSLDFIHSDRSVYKVVDLDEAWAFLQMRQGKSLSMRLAKAGRSMNAGVYFVTQNTADLLDEQLKNLIGLRFAFNSTDANEVRNILKFMGVEPEDEGNQKAVMGLKIGQCLMRDIYGRVGVVEIHPVFGRLLTAFNTKPGDRGEADEAE